MSVKNRMLRFIYMAVMLTFFVSISVKAEERSLSEISSNIKTESMVLNYNKHKTVKIDKTKLGYSKKDKAPSARWYTSDPHVIQVNEKGKVTGINRGKATLYAEVDNSTYSLEVFVNRPHTIISYVNTDKDKDKQNLFRMKKGEKKRIDMAGFLSPQVIRWTSGDKNVVKVSKNGVLTATGKGYTIVTARIGRCKYKFRVRVKEKGSVHEHEYKSRILYKAGTVPGEKLFYCSCGSAYTELYSCDHEWDDGVIIKNASCTSIGVMEYKCTICGETRREDIPKTPHSEGIPVKENMVESSCTMSGGYNLNIYCEKCGGLLSSSYVPVGKKPHIKGNAVRENEVKPSCLIDGGYDLNVYCKECGILMSSQQEVVPKTGHTGKPPVKENIIPSKCEEDGSYSLDTYCEKCNALIKSEPRVIPKKGHNWEYSHSEDADCCNARKDIYMCSRCEKDKSVASGDPKGHTPGASHIENSVSENCISSGEYDEVVRCQDCGVIISSEHKDTPALGHDGGEKKKENEVLPSCVDGSYDIVSRCRRCNEIVESEHFTVPAVGSHTFKDGICTVCKRTAYMEGVPGLYKEDGTYIKYFSELEIDFSEDADHGRSGLPALLKTSGYEGTARIILPTDTDIFGDYSMYALDNITEIRFSVPAKQVGAYAFANNTADISVSLDDTAETLTIGEGAFSNSSISKMILPENCNVGYQAFKGSSLSEVEINCTLTSGNEFEDCRELKQIKINADITGQNTFSGCVCENKTVQVGQKSKEFGGFICSPDSFDAVLLETKNSWKVNGNYIDSYSPEAVIDKLSQSGGGSHFIKQRAFGIYDSNGDLVVELLKADVEKDYSASSPMSTALGVSPEKVSEIIIPYNATRLGNFAFYGCNSARTITIPCDSLESVGRGCFAYCTELSELVIPNSVSEIGKSAFYGMQGSRIVYGGNAEGSPWGASAD